MADYKRITLVLPANSKWDAEDLAVKAEKFGMTKNEFMVKAIDMLYNFDDSFFNYINHYSKGLNIPEYMIMQNMIIKRMAAQDAKKEVYGSLNQILDEFLHVTDDKGTRTVTGEELYKILKDKEVQELKNEERKSR